jgi:hypothetical protein
MRYNSWAVGQGEKSRCPRWVFLHKEDAMRHWHVTLVGLIISAVGLSAGCGEKKEKTVIVDERHHRTVVVEEKDKKHHHHEVKEIKVKKD